MGRLPRQETALRAQLASFDGHPLLATLGQQGREFQQMLLEQAQFELDLDSFEENVAGNNLQCLQNDILANRQPDTPLQADGSIGIHACHSRMREVQVIKNQLLEDLEQDSLLELRDIVVMAPDIQQYAPVITAVFDDIQHAIADRSLRLSNSALDLLLRLLHLSRSRFGWQAALERLLMGYAMADDGDFVAGVLPYRHIEGSAGGAGRSERFPATAVRRRRRLQDTENITAMERNPVPLCR